jgi:hypothetical protein
MRRLRKGEKRYTIKLYLKCDKADSNAFFNELGHLISKYEGYGELI